MILKRNNIFLLLIISCLSCTAPIQVVDQTDPIERIDFTYFEEEEKLYIGAVVKNPFNGNSIRYVTTAWFGLNKIDAVTPDSIVLEDVGVKGDILIGDKLYATKMKTVSLLNKVVYGDTGRVYLKIVAHYEQGESHELLDSSSLGNISPRFLMIDVPDTLILPDSGLAKLITVRAQVEDANGLSDIQWVGFTSKLLDENRMLNNGDYIYLVDTGDTTYGDATKGDSIFSRTLAFPYDAERGRLEWRFRAQDWQGDFDYSSKVVVVKK